MIRHAPISTLFPYTTLFRSLHLAVIHRLVAKSGSRDHVGKVHHQAIGPGQNLVVDLDRKSTRLNSSHSQISYAVFCLKKKNSAPLPLAAPTLPSNPPRYSAG